MFTGILLSTVLLSPSAPVPKAAKPLGPPPHLVSVPPARQGQVVVIVQSIRKVAETYTVAEVENGVPVQKTKTRDVEVPVTTSVTLDNTGATFKTAGDKPLTAEEANEKLKAGGVLFVPAPGEDEIDAAYAKMLSADAILVSYKADKVEEKKRIATTAFRAGPQAAATPSLATVKADDKGVVQLPARGTKEVTVTVPVTKNENGQATIEYVEQKQTVAALLPTPFEQIKPEVSTADGKPVAAEDAKKRLAAGAIVLVSGDGKPVDESYRKLFQPDTLVLASEKMVLNPRPLLRAATVAPAPVAPVK